MRILVRIMLCGLLLAFGARAEDTKRVAVLYYGSRAAMQDLRAFLDGMRELGWVEGRNVLFDIRFAEGRTERFPDLAADLVARKPDVLVTVTTPGSLAAKEATSTIPIVVLAASDPLGTGLVTSLARPGGNITGFSMLAPELSAKRVDLLKQVKPGFRRLAVLWNVRNQGMQLRFKEVSAATGPLGVEVLSFGVEHPSEFDAVFDAMTRARPEALLVMADTVTLGQRQRAVEVARTLGIPAIYEQREFVDAGGMMSYGIRMTDQFREGAVYTDRILRGAHPGTMPIRQPERFDLIVNLRTAKVLGISIPQSILIRADEVIE